MKYTGLQTGPVALYSQLANVFRDKITSGDWKNGEDIPTLDELKDQFSVARITVRQAIQILVAEGMLSSHRGRRTFVTYKLAKDNVRPMFYSSGSLGEEDPNYSPTILLKERAKSIPLLYSSLGTALSSYVRIKKVDSVAGYQFSCTDNYIASSVFSRFPRNAERRHTLTALTLTYSPIPVTYGKETISIDRATQEEAGYLRAPLSSPVARIVRVFLGPKNELLYLSLLCYRGERFRIERDLSEFLRK